ncbi:MAG: two pore domain potassium channel family protein [Gammaproteobacteria bacterium]|nr:MAG: two pore domain potassium channel family protein [Gammaproteobacteria bacterium]
MEFTFAFLHLCLLGIYLLTPPLVFLLALIIILGQVAGKIEGWERPNALYWSFITALTIGYGDIRPTKKSTKLLSILIGLTGIIFTGILVAITVTAATKSLSNVIDLSSMSK